MQPVVEERGWWMQRRLWWTKRVGGRSGLVDKAGCNRRNRCQWEAGGVVYNSCQQLFGVSLFTTFIGLQGQPRRSVLGQLQDEGALTYNRDRDEIVVPLVGAGPPPPAPTPDAV